MDITPLVPADRQYIQSYGGGGFRVSNVRFEGAVLILPERTVAWPVTDVPSSSASDYGSLFEPPSGVEILLIGCGPSMQFVPAALRQELRDKGVVVDAMDTGAACRTYNVLLTEDRRVAAALLPVD